MNPFDFVNAINSTKVDLIRDSENPELAEKSYNPFITNRALSYFIDTLLYATEMNLASGLDNKLQNDYLINSIRKGKRFSKWSKPIEDSNVSAVQDYYKVNYAKALEISKILTAEQIDLIKIRITKGVNDVQPKPTDRGST
ncbi:clamp loader small subunit [uncultured Caudovirales phage]|uniref:Clamp loader small subunit n=1 Tax=uncultured Caudovirales phage TaxID=2100421 RepID=A0A6J7WXC5_9CAUD|nr:clamp loader small subunit [uncultured Caudovirales phage]